MCRVRVSSRDLVRGASVGKPAAMAPILHRSGACRTSTILNSRSRKYRGVGRAARLYPGEAARRQIWNFGERFIELARLVYQTNERRGEFKRQINEILHSAIVEEKCSTG